MSHRKSAVCILLACILIAIFGAQAKDAKNNAPSEKIPSGAKMFIGPIKDGFDTFLKDAIGKKKVPVELVASRDQADYEITGTAETQKAGAAKKIILGNWHSREEASITVSNIKSGEVVWAYSVHEEASTHGKRSSAEACAKHLKEAMESK
ncbi:MAG: hypothetical protein DMG88_16420 [Acidobacteria bacterium]|nr:MAG: hypothetical protein DMG88_16420 [Acidobacteriota bacterium]